MNDLTNEAFPYAQLAVPVLDVIYASLSVLVESSPDSIHSPRTYKKLVDCAEPLKSHPHFKSIPKLDGHIFEGLNVKRSITPKEFEDLPRIARLCVIEWEKAKDHRESDSPAIFIPSPLSILREILTIPKFKESEAYGHAVATRMLFSSFGLFYPTGTSTIAIDHLDHGDIIEGLESIRTYILHRDNSAYPKKNIKGQFLRHYLALRGSFRIRFGTEGKVRKDPNAARCEALKWLDSKPYCKTMGMRNDSRSSYEFRLSSGLVDIPESQQIVNEITGIPLALPGSDVVFFGGLRRSESNSSIISIVGAPGTGKTSLSLALAAVLSPFGTTTLFCSFEEDSRRLRSRLDSIIPKYFQNTSLLQRSQEKWMFPIQMDQVNPVSEEDFTTRYIDQIRSRLLRNISDPTPGALPTIVPFLIVIDGLAALRDDLSTRDGFTLLLSALRRLGCLVILLSAEGIPEAARLEYHVDTVIKLKYPGTDNLSSKPVRLFQLEKSRLQLSRPGAHLLHLSGDDGIRISPQLSSQLDSRKVEDRPLPSTHLSLMTLYPDTALSNFKSQNRLLQVFLGSKILIYGHGSSGKAGFGLKLLLSPAVTDNGTRREAPSQFRETRTLVVSFLYPEEYYSRIFDRLQKLGRSRHPDGFKCSVDTLFFNPGYLRPEDFIQKVIRVLDEAIFDGRPFSRILIDGVHNVFLQFPYLQKEDLVWPTLYSILSKYDLTIATTFTTFTSPGFTGTSLKEASETEFILEGHRPLLHMLVQGVDFLLQVEKSKHIDETRRFEVSALAAISQPVPDKKILWDAESLLFGEFSLPTESAQRQLPLSQK